MLKNLFIAIALVLLCALTALAKPPGTLTTFLASQTVVFDGKCNIKSQKLKGVECLILEIRPDIHFIVLFDDSVTEIIQVIGVTDGQEVIVWSSAI